MPTSVELAPLFDSTLERVGFPLDHPYLERVYCSVLGPTAVLFLRRAGELLEEHPHGLAVDLVDQSRSLGVGLRRDVEEVGRRSPVCRAMDRVAQFRLARWTDEGRLGIHTRVPAVSRHRASRLSQSVQAAHHRLLTEHLGGLVARAEGRAVDALRIDPPDSIRGLQAPEPPEPPGSPVAARLRAFGTNSHDPRAIIR